MGSIADYSYLFVPSDKAKAVIDGVAAALSIKKKFVAIASTVRSGNTHLVLEFEVFGWPKAKSSEVSEASKSAQQIRSGKAAVTKFVQQISKSTK